MYKAGTLLKIALVTPVLFSCTPRNFNSSETKSQYPSQTIDQRKDDITVLKAFNTNVEISFSGDFNDCPIIAGATETNRKVDCTDAIERSVKNAYQKRYNTASGPFISKIIFNQYKDGDRWNSSYYNCKAIEIQTISRQAAFDVANAIGFGVKNEEGRSFFRGANPENFVEVGKATLKDGTPAVIHRFLFSALCWQGTGSSSSNASYQFRPYIQFRSNENGPTKTYTNWDNVQDDYLLGRRLSPNSDWVESFDRSNELLRR